MNDAMIHAPTGEVTGLRRSLLIVTSEAVPGRTVTEVCGLVRGNTIRARHLGTDIMAVLRNIVGGEIREYTKLMAECREQAIDRMTKEAEARGADAILAFRFATSEVAKAAAEVVAYGTAVTLKPK